MALAELLRTLEAQAGERVDALLARARADADRLRADRADVIARRHAAALAAREVELRATAVRELEERRREATRQLLQARAEVLDRIRNRSEALLTERLEDPALSGALAGELERALDYFGSVRVVVEAPATVVDALRRRLGDRAYLVLEPTPARRPRLVARAADGSLSVDAAPASRLARDWPRLAIELASRLEALTS
jgi:vacuolar-type H+-ATPase subunit E/Vma4